MLLPLTKTAQQVVQGRAMVQPSGVLLCGIDDNQIFINVPEIETQIDSIDELEDPDDFTINKCGDTLLAYYYVGNGLLVGIDLEKLQSEINDLNA